MVWRLSQFLGFSDPYRVEPIGFTHGQTLHVRARMRQEPMSEIFGALLSTRKGQTTRRSDEKWPRARTCTGSNDGASSKVLSCRAFRRRHLLRGLLQGGETGLASCEAMRQSQVVCSSSEKKSSNRYCHQDPIGERITSGSYRSFR